MHIKAVSDCRYSKPGYPGDVWYNGTSACDVCHTIYRKSGIPIYDISEVRYSDISKCSMPPYIETISNMYDTWGVNISYIQKIPLSIAVVKVFYRIWTVPTCSRVGESVKFINMVVQSYVEFYDRNFSQRSMLFLLLTFIVFPFQSTSNSSSSLFFFGCQLGY